NVIERVKKKIEELKPSLPEGVEIKIVYDRSGLIERAINTLKRTLIEENIVVSIVIIIFLLHFRSALIPIISLPIAVLISFIPMYYVGITPNIMSLGGIAIAVGAMVDAEIVMVEATHKAIEKLRPGYSPEERHRAQINALIEVTPSIFYALVIVAIAFLPVFTLTGQAGKLFKPLAWTKTFAMLTAAFLSITLAPALRDIFIRGKIYSEKNHPISRVLIAIYKPFVYVGLRNPKTTIAIGIAAMLSAVPMALKLGSEFMPPLNEGDALYMPTTFPNISIEEAKRYLQYQDRVLKSFPEVEVVFGKTGRAETPTDPAPLSMVETVVKLKPQEEWRKVRVDRWYSSWAPEFLKKGLRWLFPEERHISWEELMAEFDNALKMPGWTNAWTMPIKTRIDMLTTGIRTPVGVKIFGDDLAEIERIGMEIEKAVSKISGVRSVFSDRNLGGFYVDIVPDREKIARYGLQIEDVNDVIEAAVGGMPVSTTIEGRNRFTINVRYPKELREDAEKLKNILIPVKTGGSGGENSGMAMGGGNQLTGGLFKGSEQISLSQVAEIHIKQGPPMIKDEDGMLVGYVYIDVDTAKRDIGGFVNEAKKVVEQEVNWKKGFYPKWTGQYELMELMQKRMKIVVPLTIFLVFMLLYLHFRNFMKVFIVFLSLPFSLIGSVWLMHWLGHNISTASWVGVIALLGLAAETGIVMIIYLDLAYEEKFKQGLIKTKDDIIEAVLEGSAGRVRPKLMTVGTTFIGLVPLLWAEGSGADVMRRLAAPMIGGLFTSTFLTLEIIPVIYLNWRWRQVVKRENNVHL
ncbi:MAG: efflux RND transporter permease subunit, partial [Deltaproteobacteria bacterium]|nr:efflux RND transporter permease subunit [Deltaproteobacteria bacterium]